MSAARMFAPTPSQYPESRQCCDLFRVEKALEKVLRRIPWQSDLKEAPSSVAKEAARGTRSDKAPVQTQEAAGVSV